VESIKIWRWKFALWKTRTYGSSTLEEIEAKYLQVTKGVEGSQM
jgi:hypothetical protein